MGSVLPSLFPELPMFFFSAVTMSNEKRTLLRPFALFLFSFGSGLHFSSWSSLEFSLSVFMKIRPLRPASRSRSARSGLPFCLSLGHRIRAAGRDFSRRTVHQKPSPPIPAWTIFFPSAYAVTCPWHGSLCPSIIPPLPYPSVPSRL